MNAKLMIAIAAFALVFSGVAVSAESADIEGSAEIQDPIPFYVDYGPDSDIEKTTKWLNVETADGTIELPTLETLGIVLADGYTFNGWFVAAEDGSAVSDGACYNPGTKLTLSDNNGFYASISANTYTIVFKDASGNVIPIKDGESEKDLNDGLNLGGTITMPDAKYSTPEVGQIFVGWVDEEGNVLTTDANNNYIVKGNATYTATFKADIKAVFVVDGIVTYTGYANTGAYPTDPMKESFTFIGWAVDDEVKYKANAGFETLKDLGLTADTTFTAVFEPAIYTVSFEVDGQIVATQTVKHGELATEPAFVPALEGMDFVEWDFDFAQAITGDTTIVAVFEPTPEPEPTGLSNPTVQIMAIVIGVLIIFIVAVLVWKKDDVRVIIVKKLDKSKKSEEPKQ